MSAEAIRRCLEDLDVPRMMRLNAELFPQLQAQTDPAICLATMHRARTQHPKIADRLRFYSHRWLLDHGLPSGLPDHLKPSAERVYPKMVGAVGIAVGSLSQIMAPVSGQLRGAMENAVLEAEADGKLDDVPHVRARMAEAKQRERRKLIGR